MCISILQEKDKSKDKKKKCVAASLHILKLNTCNKVNNNVNKVNKVNKNPDLNYASYERFLQKKRCIKF